MAGSGWTVETLLVHVEKILAEKDRALTAALASAKEAVDKAEDNSEKWRAQANEWRGAMSDREKNFLTRTEFLAFKESSELALAARKTTQDVQQGRGQGISASWAFLVGFVGLVGAIIGIVIALQ